jgi:hypothetical protein
MSEASQFTYDFGIAISQQAIASVTRLAGVSLSLASAMYAINTFSKEYVKTLKMEAVYFGGYLKTIQSMQEAQDRLLQGMTTFSMKDQLNGMNQLRSVGVDVQKNFEFLSKTAHAMGTDFTSMSGAVASAISGNMQGLISMGVMTQRAARMFDKYEANTVMREQAVMSFLKNHKGILSMIKNDFETMEDQLVRLKGVWESFLKAVMGDPKDPTGLYGQITGTLKRLAEAFSRNVEMIKRAGFVIGKVLGWVFRQVGNVSLWVGHQFKKLFGHLDILQSDFQERTYAMIVRLEFWKNHILNFLREHKTAIKTIAALILSYMGLKLGWSISKDAIGSVIRYRREFMNLIRLVTRRGLGTMIVDALSMRALSSASSRQLLRALGISNIRHLLFGILNGVMDFFTLALPGFFTAMGTALADLFVGVFTASLPAISAALAAIPVAGWILLAVAAIVVLYYKWEWFRNTVNQNIKDFGKALKSLFGFIWSLVKFLGAVFNLLWANIKNGFVQAWVGLKTWISDAWREFKQLGSLIGEALYNSLGGGKGGWWDKLSEGISKVWDSIKNSSAVKWLKENFFDPMSKFFSSFTSVFDFFAKFYDLASSFVNKGSDYINAEADKVNANTDYWMGKQPTPKPQSPNGTVPIKSATEAKKQSTPQQEVTAAFGNTGKSEQATNNTSNVTVQPGAVVINVNKADGWDENKMAKKIREVLQEVTRTENIRKGRT